MGAPAPPVTELFLCKESFGMVPDAVIWRAAIVVVQRFDEHALDQTVAHAAQYLKDGDWQAALTCIRILDAIKWLRAKAPAEGETTH